MTYEELLEALDFAERAVSDLRNDFLEICPEDLWEEGMIQEMNDAENEVYFFQQMLDSGDFDEDVS